MQVSWEKIGKIAKYRCSVPQSSYMAIGRWHDGSRIATYASSALSRNPASVAVSDKFLAASQISPLISHRATLCCVTKDILNSLHTRFSDYPVQVLERNRPLHFSKHTFQWPRLNLKASGDEKSLNYLMCCEQNTSHCPFPGFFNLFKFTFLYVIC